MADDWWTDLYDPAAGDTSAGGRRATTAPARPVRGGSRLPDWRTGEHVDLTAPAEPDPGPDRPDAPGPEADSKAPTPTVASADTDPDTPDTADPDPDSKADDGAEPSATTPPPWDPTVVTARILQAHNDHPLHDRAAAAIGTALAAAITTATATRPQPGRLLYIASAIAAPWWVGLTPWLIDHLDGAPTGISIALIAIGWSLHRTASAAAAPITWCGHSLYTCCVTAAFLA